MTKKHAKLPSMQRVKVNISAAYSSTKFIKILQLQQTTF